MGKTGTQLEFVMSSVCMEGLAAKTAVHICNCGPLSVVYLTERPGELHVFGSGVAALQQPGSAVHVHQTLVVVVIDGRTQHSQVELLGAGVVDILLGNRDRED